MMDPERLLLLRATAIHEAGHAVAALLFGFTFGKVQIWTNNSGVVTTGDESSKPMVLTPEEARRFAIVCAAGLAAEVRYLALADRNELDDWARQGAQYDTANLHKFAKIGNMSEHQSRAAATALVAHNWHGVVRMSEQLVRERFLSARRLNHSQAARAAGRVKHTRQTRRC